MEKIDAIIIGAGVVGLGIGANIASSKSSLYVLERHDAFGTEASSRNSEVIHAGIYYEQGSLKAKTCVEGNRRLYELCKMHKIPFRKTGKLIVATEKREEEQLEELLSNGKNNGVEGLEILTKKEVNRIEPDIIALYALYSSATGIIDSHSLMLYFIKVLKEKSANVVYNSEVIGIIKTNQGYEVSIKDKTGDIVKVLSKVVINSAGLNSDKIAQMVGIDIEKEHYRLNYCKGQYFRISDSRKCKRINHLVYPVPEIEKGGLGIHATLDLGDSIRLGPDSHYINKDEIDYDVDISEKRNFFDSVVKFLPFLEEDDLIPDLAGIRPKLQGENEEFRDFVIKEESSLGYPGFVNLIGIESPGLTATISIAEYVKDQIKGIV